MSDLRAKGQVSAALSEIRTIHSRAVTALSVVEQRFDWAGNPYPDTDMRSEICSDLTKVIAITEKWRRK